MMLLARRIKHPFDVPVQCPHDTDARKHRRAAVCCDQDKRFHRGLPLWPKKPCTVEQPIERDGLGRRGRADVLDRADQEAGVD
jgi:hypothetical protein